MVGDEAHSAEWTRELHYPLLSDHQQENSASESRGAEHLCRAEHLEPSPKAYEPGQVFVWQDKNAMYKSTVPPPPHLSLSVTASHSANSLYGSCCCHHGSPTLCSPYSKQVGISRSLTEILSGI